MKGQKLKMWPITRFVEYEKNPRVNNHAVDKFASAIKEFGFRVPMLAKSDGTIVDGHLRLKAARKLGLKTIPVLLADDLTDAQIKAFRISVNKMADLAQWDEGILGEEFAALAADGFDLSLTGFEPDEMGGSSGSGKASGVTEIETSELHDRFWISIRGPLKSQAKALQVLRKATAGIEGVQVELGTTDELF